MKQFLLTKTEVTYMKHYFQKEARLGLAAIIILTLFVFGFIVPIPLIEIALSLFGGEFIFTAAYDRGSLSLVFIAICILAYLLPLYLFRFLMKRSGNDLYLSLPIERKRLFYVHYLIGIIYLIAASLMILALYCMFINIPSILQAESGYSVRVMLYFILNCYFILLGVCLYTFFTYLTVRCHTLLDAILMGIAYTLLPLLIYYAGYALLEHATASVLISTDHSIYGENILIDLLKLPAVTLSIPIQMNLWIQHFASCGGETSVSLEMLLLDGAIWIIFAIGCFFASRKAFVRIRSEQSGQTTNAFFTYPLLIPLVTFLLLVSIQGESPLTIITLLVAVAYMLAEFIAKRRIAFSFKKLLLFCALVLCSNLLFLTLTQTKVFGSVKEIPDINDVTSVKIEVIQYVQESEDTYISSQYTGTSSDTEDIAYVMEEHSKLTETAKQSVNESDSDIVYIISYLYESKAQQTVSRSYIFYQKDLNYIKALIEKWQDHHILHETSE